MEIRMFRQGDKDKLLSLLRTTFDGWHGDSFWDWLYQNNPSGKSSIGVAIEGGKIVASYSVCPAPIILGKESHIIGLGIDASTHPQYRRRGLFEKVAMVAFADAETRGFDCILGYSEWGRPAAQGQVTKLGFSKVFAIKRLVKVLSWPKVFAFKAKLPVHPPSGEQVKNRIYGALKERDRVDVSILSRSDVRGNLSKAVSEESIVVCKSPEYVRWRYFDNPEKEYIVFASNSSSGFPAFSALTIRREQRSTVGVIVDIFGNHEEWKPLLKSIEIAMRLSGVSLLETYISEGHDAVPLVTSMGYKDRTYSLVGILRQTANASSDNRRLTLRTKAWKTTIADDPSL